MTANVRDFMLVSVPQWRRVSPETGGFRLRNWSIRRATAGAAALPLALGSANCPTTGDQNMN